ncbi:hypothetical protein PBI_ELVA_40 [Microbacterium phage Elva]|uniref:hypothetical protein n=1 Tax=Microbacterium phage Elva TaxID=2126929 RepID=UPI000D229EAE|nr:hypothetical protein QDW20_gp40 [Microbacterium phage Elva]AVR56781.1 hypothetical protein PBI_ELVA_40 [Microbacterium phage Elva]
MNSNETSILPHVVAMPLVTAVNELAAKVLEEKGEVYSTANILLDVISVVNDNAGFEVELRVTCEGFQIAFPQSIESDEVLGAMNQGIEVISEMALED